MSTKSNMPSVYNFLYQPVVEGESAQPAETFLLGVDSQKYYLHNNLDYSDAAVSLNPGTSFTLETKTMKLNASNSITISNNVEGEHVQFYNKSLDIHGYSFQIAPKDAKAVPSFYVNATDVTLKSANDFNFQSQKGVLDFTSSATGNNKWCSAACFKNTYSAANGAYNAVCIGVYKNDSGTARCALDARANDGTKEDPAPLNIGLLSKETIIGANNHEGLRVTTATVGDTTRPVVSVKQNGSWKEIASKGDIEKNLSTGSDWIDLGILQNTSDENAKKYIKTGWYYMEVYSDVASGKTALGLVYVDNLNLTFKDFTYCGYNNNKFMFVDSCCLYIDRAGWARILERGSSANGWTTSLGLRIKKLL